MCRLCVYTNKKEVSLYLRRYALVACAAVAAVLTPPDVVSMLLLLVPLYSLYEFAILAIRLTHWRAARKVNAEPEVPDGA